jgi:RNA polymerase sigma factor (sigma-70 family)
MSGTQSSQSLLAEYAKNGSEHAFRELVTAYIDFVFGTALRVVGGDRALAEDVSQTVFTDLARKAITLPREVKLGGWLHRHTCFVGRKALRRERRRIARERQAMQLTTIEDYTEENLGQLSTLLDETINGLGKEDRNAIILRFFEQLDYRALGTALGSSEDAARMRVSRALEKMGSILRRRGVAMSLSGLSFVLSTKTAGAAPVGLATKISAVALAQSLKGWAIVGFLKDACFTRLNLGIGSGAVAVVTALILVIPARHGRAMLDISNESVKPSDFAGLASDDNDPSPPVAEETRPEQATITPASAVAPVPAAPTVVPAVWRPVAIVTFPKTNAPSVVPQPTNSTPSLPLAGAGEPLGGLASYGVTIRRNPIDLSNPNRFDPPSYGQLPSQPTVPGGMASNGVANSKATPTVIMPPDSAAYPGGVHARTPPQTPQIGNPPASAVVRGNRNNQNNRQRQP